MNRSEPIRRIIQEHVPGKQISLAHMISGPRKDLYAKLGLDKAAGEAVGILTITPGEGAIIAADIAGKAAAVTIDVLDRAAGSLVFVGDVGSVEAALNSVVAYFDEVLHYASVPVTRS